VMMAGVGVIEEYDRLLRLLPDMAVSQHQSAEPLPLDPRRRIRSPVNPAEFPTVEDGLKKLCVATKYRVSIALKFAAESRSSVPHLFDFARRVHAFSVMLKRHWLLDLTKYAVFPRSLAISLNEARTPPEIQRAIAAFDAHAEATLG